MTKKQKTVLYRIIASAILILGISILCEFADVNIWGQVVLYLIPYFVIGYDILRKAFKGILNKQVFDENFLMAIATVGAMLLGEFKEGVAVMLFYQIGELFQSCAVGKSRRNIAALMDIRPDYANIIVDGQIEQVDPDDVEIGTEIVVNPGEKVPIDGIITEGNTTLNTSALTGESVPRDAKAGEEVISGCINMTGAIKLYSFEDFGFGRKFKYEEVTFRKLHYKIRQILYSGSLLRSISIGYFATNSKTYYGNVTRLS